MTATIEIQGSAVGPGDRVVYPNGGICKVRGIERKNISGYDLTMLVLQREEDDAVVMVPQGKVAQIGLRKVATAEAIKLLFEYFTSSNTDPELDWKVRHRDNTELMSAGGLLDTAKVLKGLHALAQIRPLPTKEREMYDSARHQLVGEISASLNLPPAVAENHIDYALSPPPGSGRTAPKDVPIDLKALRRTLGGPRKAGGGDEDLDLEEESEDTMLGLEEEGEGEEAEGEAAEGEAAPAAAGEEEGEEEAPKAKAPKKAAAKEKAPKEKAPKAAPKEKAPKKEPAAKVAAPAPVDVPMAAPEPRAEVPAQKPVATPAAKPVPAPAPPAEVVAKPVAAPAPKPQVSEFAEEKSAPKKAAPAEKPAAEKAPAKKTPAKKAEAKAEPKAKAPAKEKAEAKEKAPAKAAAKAPAKKAPVKEAAPKAKTTKGAKK